MSTSPTARVNTSPSPVGHHGEGIKSMPKENAINGKRPATPHHHIKGDKPGHHDNKEYDRMHAREVLPTDHEKAHRPYHAKDPPRGANTRRSNPERDRASR